MPRTRHHRNDSAMPGDKLGAMLIDAGIEPERPVYLTYSRAGDTVLYCVPTQPGDPPGAVPAVIERFNALGLIHRGAYVQGLPLLPLTRDFESELGG